MNTAKLVHLDDGIIACHHLEDNPDGYSTAVVLHLIAHTTSLASPVVIKVLFVAVRN